MLIEAYDLTLHSHLLAPQIRFYAAAPVTMEFGERIVIDNIVESGIAKIELHRSHFQLLAVDEYLQGLLCDRACSTSL